MRVGILAPEITVAHGWGRYTIDLANALVGLGDVEVVIAASANSPDIGQVAHSGFAPALPNLMDAQRGSTPRSMAAAWGLRRFFAGCDVIHTTAEHFLPAAALIAGRRPLFVTAHGTYLPRVVTGRMGLLFRLALRRAHVLAVSAFTAGQVRAAIPQGTLPDARLHVIHNGVHVAQFNTPPAVLPPKHGPTILCVGVNKARKGMHVLLEAMPAVLQAVPDAQCVIIGSQSSPAYQQQLQDILAAHTLQEHVSILGRVPEETLFGWYHQADVFALPSVNVGDKFEGFGLVYLEAGAAGLPVIGTWGCGAEDAIRDTETGFLVPQRDTAALAEKIITLLQDADLRAQMGQAGRAQAEAHRWANIAALVRERYVKA